MHKITGVNGGVWYYNQPLSLFLDSQKNPIDTTSLDSFLPWKYTHDEYTDRLYKYRRLDPDVKRYVAKERVKRIKVQLGFKCNYRCKYCCQSDARHFEAPKIDLDKFFKMVKNSDLIWDQIVSVEIWGGEPLVYWKSLKPIIEFFRTEMGYNGSLYITTNGSLFTPDKAEILAKYNVKVMFSHDGPAQKYWRHDDDWMDNDEIRLCVADYIKRGIRQFGASNTGTVNFVPTPQNTPFEKTIDFFNEKLFDGVPIGLEAALRCTRENYPMWKREFTPEAQQQMEDSLYRLCMLKPDDRYYTQTIKTKMMLAKTINNLASGRLATSFNSKCPTLGRDVLTFDTVGRIVVCHNSFPHYKCNGNVEDLSTCYYLGLQSFHTRAECQTCWRLMSCGGSCPLDDNYQHTIECESVKWFDKAYFRGAWTFLFGEDIKSIEEI